MTPKIQVEIDTDDLLPTMHYGPDGEFEGEPGAPLEALVVEAAARQIIRSDRFDDEVRRKVERRVEEVIDERVQASVSALVDEAITTPIQRRHPWGDEIGEPIMVREIVREHVEAFFKASPRRDSYGSQGRENGVAEMIQNFTRDALGKELQEEVKAARKKVGDQIRDKALQAAVDAIAPRTY